MQNNLQRFIDAQKSVYETVLKELKNANKVSHWMWYIFPQIKGLGFSSTSQFYGIADKDEAVAYLSHPILGQRLIDCCEILLTHHNISAEQIFGGIDSVKLKSSMTLFANVFEQHNLKADLATQDNIFKQVLEKYFHGEQDKKTLELLI